ncbi:MAG: hypothetical protein V4443_00685 [Pseudomonadota bacterium]
MRNLYALAAVIFAVLYVLVFAAIYITDSFMLPTRSVQDASLIALVFGVAGALVISSSQT